MDWQAEQAENALTRLLPRIEALIENADERAVFVARLRTHFSALIRLLHSLYGNYYDFFDHLEAILATAAYCYNERPIALKTLDQQREADPLWFQSEKMLGGVCYVDLFAGDLAGIREKIPYFEELGLTYLHLMPLFESPAASNDGGYAINSFREVNPALGTMAELAELAAELRARGISLVLDFVFNHTSDEHEWAQKALGGDKAYQRFYFMFPNRELPDQYEQHLREIFPQQDPGNFTYRPENDQWVWTTFRHFQWDLNYSNPAVFNAMLGEMLFLANQGVEVLRLDAVPFIWKQMGTSCENLPHVHAIIQAFNALMRVAAPALLFKSEAIVHPNAVASYIGWDQCPFSYNPTLMALLWEALATRDVRLLRHSMSRRFTLPENTAWINYIRSHDDIGWTFADEDAAELGIDGFGHRQFLNAFYSGDFDGSFAAGLPFNYNPLNRDMRVSGTAASLAGLEQALQLDNALYTEHALRRIILLHSVIISAGGIPLLYLGDEIATLNDYSYSDQPAKADDSRWAHRPAFDWERAAGRRDENISAGRIFQALSRLIKIRKGAPAFANGGTLFFDSGNPGVLAYTRQRDLMMLANFSEREQRVERVVLTAYWPVPDEVVDLVSRQTQLIGEHITLEPYQFMWLRASRP